MSTPQDTPPQDNASAILQSPELETLLADAEALLRRIADESGIDLDIDEELALADAAARQRRDSSDDSSEQLDPPSGPPQAAPSVAAQSPDAAPAGESSPAIDKASTTAADALANATAVSDAKQADQTAAHAAAPEVSEPPPSPSPESSPAKSPAADASLPEQQKIPKPGAPVPAATRRVVGAVVGTVKSCGRGAALAPLIVLAMLDRPFAGISPRARLHVGITGLITLLMGVLLWVLPSVMERNPYAEIPLPQTSESPGD